MALGNGTVAATVQNAAHHNAFIYRLSFAGDGAYPTGGTANFSAYVHATVEPAITVAAVIPQNCGGYVPVYDLANDKLMVYEAAADGNPLDEVANAANLSAVTFNVLVIGY